MKKPRGRPPGTRSQPVSQVAVETTRSEERNPVRPARVPMTAGGQLELPERKGYHRHWFQGRPGRIEEAQAAYYDFVRENGEPITRYKGEYKMYAMEIEERYWKEDQALIQRKALDTLQAEQTLASGEYVPDGRTHVLQKDDDDYDPLA